MAKPLRFAITALAIGVGVLFCLAVFYKSTPGRPNGAETAPTPPTAEAPQTATPTGVVPHATAPEGPAAAQPDTLPPTASAPAPPRSPAPPPIEGLHVVPAAEAQAFTFGSLDPPSGFRMKVQLSSYGASVRNIWLSDYHQTVEGDDFYTIQSPVEASGYQLFPLAARAVTVNERRVALESVPWELVKPGRYRVTLYDAADRPVLRITRTYSLAQGPTAYELRCDQRFENLSSKPLQLVWEQYAQGDVPNDDAAYLGDRRMLIAGYHDLDYDPRRHFIYTKNAMLARRMYLDGAAFWPNDKLPAKRELVWVANVNRYFAAAVYRPALPAPGQTDQAGAIRVLPLDAEMPHLDKAVLGEAGKGRDDRRVMALVLTSRPLDLPAGGVAGLDLSLYAGPRKNEVFAAEPFRSLNFSKLVIYELGCTLCTFQPLAKGLLAFLKFLHVVTFDWGIAIVILVLVVRLLLHPITKRSQVNMMKMSKQMQALQPEIEKLKKKYKDDPKRFQQEQIKLWREKGVNPANALGCLPMFLQTPIWIALYAMLYYAIELRHQPAFYGLFQLLSAGKWHFLADLSSPDNFIRFGGQGFTIPLYFVNPTFAGINLIPLLMMVVFYYQQKLTTPPPTNEQAAQQQKIMKFMVLLFPIFLYSAPSGLTLYILASTFAGIIDSWIVRKHIKEQEEAGTLFEKKPPKPGGFRDRIQKALEAKQRQMRPKQRGSGRR